MPEIMGNRVSKTAFLRSAYFFFFFNLNLNLNLLTNILSDQVLSFSSICVWGTLHETSDVGLFQTTLYGDLNWAFRVQLELPL